MRSVVSVIVLSLVGLSATPASASSPDDKSFDQQITALETRASQAAPREQCFLYAELVHQMTEMSLRQYAAGDADKAAGLLKQIQGFAHKIHLTVGVDNKRLKNAEILLRRTAFRLTEMLHNSSFEDRPLLQETLSQVNKAETETMLNVFRK